jgi:zinc transporter 5/7
MESLPPGSDKLATELTVPLVDGSQVLADTLGSIGVVISSLVISNYQLYWVDPFCSVLIAAMMVHLVLPLLRSSIAVLAQGAPARAEEWLAEAAAVPWVSKVQSFHCWTVAGGHVVLTIRALLEPGADVGAVREELTALFGAAGIRADRMGIELAMPRNGGDLDYAA